MAIDWGYHCVNCGKKPPENFRRMVCKKCGGDIRPSSLPKFNGTRDSFGIGKSFIDKNTGIEVDNFSTWERLGYRPALDVIKNHKVREQVKDKIKSMKGISQPKLNPEDLPY